MRDVIDNERDVQYQSAQMQMTGLISLIRMQPEFATTALRQLTKLTYPWENIPDAAKPLDTEESEKEAIEKYKDLQKSGKLKSAHTDVAAAEDKGLFKKYDFNIPDKVREAPRHDY